MFGSMQTKIWRRENKYFVKSRLLCEGLDLKPGDDVDYRVIWL